MKTYPYISGGFRPGFIREVEENDREQCTWVHGDFDTRPNPLRKERSTEKVV